MGNPSQEFTRRQLGWMRRWHSQSHLKTTSGDRPTTQVEWKDLLARVELAVARDGHGFSGLHWHNIRGKRALSTNLLEDALVIRKINDNIRRSYGIAEPNRASLVRTAMQAIRETAPKTIVRIDLKACFESIDRRSVLKRLRSDSWVSVQTMALIEGIFKQASKKFPGRMPDGIPRGLTISTSLAEIVLRDLDSKLRLLPGVYVILRYVDDLLIFSTSDELVAWKGVVNVVRSLGLKINSSKSGVYRVACRCESSCVHEKICPCSRRCECSKDESSNFGVEYLGYKIIFGKHNSGGGNDVFCVLSDRKSSRIKTRIVSSIQDVAKTKDWGLFEKRVLYLTGNQKVAGTPGMRGLFNGLAYTHSEYSEPAEGDGMGTLADLDAFYQMSLRRLLDASIVKDDIRARLKSLSFESGFLHRRRTKFTAQQVLKVKLCWRD